MRLLVIALLAVAGCSSSPLQLYDVDGEPIDPFEDRDTRAQVFVFTRSDCPISNRYAPEISRLSASFGKRGVRFWLVYVDPAETAESIESHRSEYGLSTRALRDPQHTLVERTSARVTPEAAVFTDRKTLAYRGRIDDRFPDYGISHEPKTAELRLALEAVLDGRAVEPAVTEAVGCFISDLR